MTQEEFQDLTGRKVTKEEYRNIEKMYYAVPNMDKHEFCKYWIQTGNNPLTIELTKQIILLNGMLEERSNEAEDCHSKMEKSRGSSLARLLLMMIQISIMRLSGL